MKKTIEILVNEKMELESFAYRAMLEIEIYQNRLNYLKKQKEQEHPKVPGGPDATTPGAAKN